MSNRALKYLEDLFMDLSKDLPKERSNEICKSVGVNMLKLEKEVLESQVFLCDNLINAAEDPKNRGMYAKGAKSAMKIRKNSIKENIEKINDKIIQILSEE